MEDIIDGEQIIRPKDGSVLRVGLVFMLIFMLADNTATFISENILAFLNKNHDSFETHLIYFWLVNLFSFILVTFMGVTFFKNATKKSIILLVALVLLTLVLRESILTYGYSFLSSTVYEDSFPYQDFRNENFMLMETLFYLFVIARLIFLIIYFLKTTSENISSTD
jgi:hypothetical protein